MSGRAYTDAPPLHANAMVGGLHLLFWLFIHPSAWAQHLANIDPGLPPDITLVELRRADWRNSRLRRLIFQGYGAWLLGSGLVYAVGLWLADVSLANGMFGIASGLVGALVFGLILGMTVSIAVGIVGSFCMSLAIWFAFGISLPLTKGHIGQTMAGLMLGATTIDHHEALVVGVAYAIAIAIVAGLTGGVAASLVRHESRAVAGRQVGAVIIGILVNIAIYVLTIGVFKSGAVNVTISILCSIGLGMFARPFPRRPLRAVGIAGACGLIYFSLIDLAHTMLPGPVSMTLGSIASSITGAMWLACFFALPAVLARRSAGAWAGAIAGTLGMGGISLGGLYVVVTMATGNSFLWPILPLSAACVFVGFTQGWWRPALTYPLLAASNLLLFRADVQRLEDPDRRSAVPFGENSHCLRWHSAFWDEHQRLRLHGLDDHLVLLLEYAPAAGQAACQYLLAGRQRWAIPRAQIEAEIREIERCRTLEDLATARHRDAPHFQHNPAASTLLRSFGRIGQDCAAALEQASSYNQRLLLSASEERLEGLVRELAYSDGHIATRFQPIALRWREIIAERRHMLTGRVEQQQLIDSPYVIGVPLTAKQAMFVGRADISARIEALVLDRQCPPLLLYGQRRMGKTSLLNNLVRLLPDAIVPMFVDLQGPAVQASDHAGFLAALARAMTATARRGRTVELPALNRHDLQTDPFPSFDEWLDAVEAALGERTVLLTLDEFEALAGAMEAGRFDEAAVLGLLRHTIQHRPRFKLMLAGSHTLDEIQRWSSYLINVQPLQIGYLSREETRQLVEHPLPNFPLAYEPAASERVYSLTNGHPALVQLLCAEIVATKNAQPATSRRLATLADVDGAVPDALERGSFFFADLQRNQLAQSSVALLRAAAERGENALFIPADPSGCAAAIDQLLRRDVLVRAGDPSSPGYRFQVELIRRWFLGTAQGEPRNAGAAPDGSIREVGGV